MALALTLTLVFGLLGFVSTSLTRADQVAAVSPAATPADPISTNDSNTPTSIAPVQTTPTDEPIVTQQPTDPPTTVIQPIDNPSPTATAIDTTNPTAESPAQNTPTTAPASPIDLGAATTTGMSNEPTVNAPQPTTAPPEVSIQRLTDTPVCQPTGDQPEIVASGGSLDYDCTDSVRLSGSNLAPSSIQIDWSVQTTVSGGWTVQLLPPADIPNETPRWTDDNLATAHFAYRETPMTSADNATVTKTFTNTQTLIFGLRVHRAACSTDAQAVTLAVAAQVSVPGSDAATTQAGTPGPDAPFTLNPALAPIPEPTLSFAGPLDFGSVAMTATGPVSPSAAGFVDVTIANLDLACGQWTVVLMAQSLSDGAEFASSNLTITSVNAQPLADGPCDLDKRCPIAVVRTGPTAPSAVTYRVGVSLALVNVTGTGTLGSTLVGTLINAP